MHVDIDLELGFVIILFIVNIHIVGFINLGSLMDLLPSKSSAQQMTLEMTRNS